MVTPRIIKKPQQVLDLLQKTFTEKYIICDYQIASFVIIKQLSKHHFTCVKSVYSQLGFVVYTVHMNFEIYGGDIHNWSELGLRKHYIIVL